MRRVSKDGNERRVVPILRDASLRDAPQDEDVLVRGVEPSIGHQRSGSRMLT